MALSLPASLSASTIGLRLIQRCDFKFNSQVAPKEGGSGVVSQATLDGELVAVKTPKRVGLSLSKRDNDNFIKESQIAASVRHQNCVALFAACRDASDPMLVMEWVGGGNLYDILADDNPPPSHVRLKNAREIVTSGGSMSVFSTAATIFCILFQLN
jgi:serine/threonine protein kinase